jgi:hypothetical protein
MEVVVWLIFVVVVVVCFFLSRGQTKFEKGACQQKPCPAKTLSELSVTLNHQ